MRLVFAGTPEFAAVSLCALLERGHDVACVLTQPDRPSGRGLRATYSPVKEAALKRGIAVLQPASLRAESVQQELRALGAEAWVVAAYGLILAAAVLALPPLGCINVHASLLPRWRGAAPIQHAILAGDGETGISIMRMDEGLDTGPVYLRRAVPIRPDDTAGTLHDRLAALGAEAVCEVLDALAAGRARAEPQPAEGACYARKLGREDARIDWTQPAAQIERLVRAFDPVPGAYTTCGGEILKVWSARLLEEVGSAAPGTVLAVDPQGIAVQCGGGSRMAITALQRPGSRRLRVAEYLRGHRIEPGTLLGS